MMMMMIGNMEEKMKRKKVIIIVLTKCHAGEVSGTTIAGTMIGRGATGRCHHGEL